MRRVVLASTYHIDSPVLQGRGFSCWDIIRASLHTLSMFPLQPQEGLLAPAIHALISDMLTELTRDDTNPIQEYIEMLETSPIVGPACEVIVLLILARFGEYQHPDEDIQEWMNSNFEQMTGSLQWSVSELAAMKPLGYSCSEWSIRDNGGEWWLDRICGLDPRKYTFQGKLGAIESLKYQGDKGDIIIPYDRVVHTVGRRWLAFGSPQGKAECRMAVAAWKAWKIVMAEALIAAQRQGTGLVVGKAPSDVMVPLFNPDGSPLLDRDGNPIRVPAPQALLNQLENLENRTVLATDSANQIDILGQQTTGELFFQLLKILQQYQLLSFLMPESILTATGAGDSNLNSGQRTTLGVVIGSTATQIKEAILEGPVRGLITYNFGEEQESWGSFPEPEESDTDAIALFTALDNAVSHGTFSNQDLAVINRMRELSGIPTIAEIAGNLGNQGNLSMGLRIPTNYWTEFGVSNGNGQR